MTPSAPQPRRATRARRLASLLLVLGAAGWAAIAVATRMIPAPAREVRFMRDGRERPGAEVRCHGAWYADGPWLWSQCEQESAGAVTRHLARLDVATGVATLLGPLPDAASGLLGVARGSGPTRAFIVGSTLIAVRGDAWHALGVAGLPLGLSVHDEAVELVDGAARPGPELRRYEAGRLVGTQALPPMAPALGRSARAQYAVRERDGWHLTFSEHATTSPTLPIEVTLFELRALGEPRRLQSLSLGPPLASRFDSGEVSTAAGAIQGGALLGGFTGQSEVHVWRRGAFERVALDDAGTLESSGGIVRGDGHLGRLFVGRGERSFWLDGERIERVVVGGRSSALRIGGRTGAPLTPSFWIEIAPRIFPREGGGYVIVGGLGQAIVRVGPDLARTDALSFGERLTRLFVDDRAKHNADYFASGGVLRSLTVPFAMLLPLLGLAGLSMSGRRPGLVVVASAVALGLALAGILPFVRVLRFYW